MNVKIGILFLLLMRVSLTAAQQFPQSVPDFSGEYDLISLTGNMYAQGMPHEHLVVVQKDKYLKVTRIEDEKSWARTIRLDGKTTVNSQTPGSREKDKAQISEEKLTIDSEHMVPPDLTRIGRRETETWELIEDKTKLRIGLHVKVVIPGISVEDKDATLIYLRQQLTQ
jgi:hypothetical protein